VIFQCCRSHWDDPKVWTTSQRTILETHGPSKVHYTSQQGNGLKYGEPNYVTNSNVLSLAWDRALQVVNIFFVSNSQEGGLLAYALEKLVLCMVIYFVISIINSMAQSYHKRLQKSKKVQS